MTTVTIPKDVNFKDIEGLVKTVLENQNAILRIPNSLNTSASIKNAAKKTSNRR